MQLGSSILEDLVSNFAAIDGGMVSQNVPALLSDSIPDQNGWGKWRPATVQTPRTALVDLYRQLPGPLPPLFEEMLLRFRWLEVDLDIIRLRANPPSEGLSGFVQAVRKDPVLIAYLLPRRLVPFGKASDLNYDPVCFDLSKARPEGDCPIVKLDHEDILYERELVARKQIAGGFRELILRILKRDTGDPAIL